MTRSSSSCLACAASASAEAAFTAPASSLDLGQQRLLFLALGLRHLLAEGVLLGAEVFEADQGCAARGVCVDDRVHQGFVGAAGALAGAELVRIFAEVFYVDHQTRVSNTGAIAGHSGRDSVGAP
jgi:hypothetical protein